MHWKKSDDIKEVLTEMLARFSRQSPSFFKSSYSNRLRTSLIRLNHRNLVNTIPHVAKRYFGSGKSTQLNFQNDGQKFFPELKWTANALRELAYLNTYLDLAHRLFKLSQHPLNSAVEKQYHSNMAYAHLIKTHDFLIGIVYDMLREATQVNFSLNEIKFTWLQLETLRSQLCLPHSLYDLEKESKVASIAEKIECFYKNNRTQPDINDPYPAIFNLNVSRAFNQLIENYFERENAISLQSTVQIVVYESKMNADIAELLNYLALPQFTNKAYSAQELEVIRLYLGIPTYRLTHQKNTIEEKTKPENEEAVSFCRMM